MKKILLSSEAVKMFSCTFLLTLIFSGFGYAQTVATDKDDYAPGEYVIITGTGWTPGEKVVFTFEEDPKPETCVNSHDFFTYASGAGEIYYDEFLIKENHLGVAFELTAVGSDSGLKATTNFTDGQGTEILLNSSNNPSLLGQNVTITAIAQKNSGSKIDEISGLLVLKIDGLQVSQKTLNGIAGNNSIVYSTSILSLGSHNISAEFIGITNNGNQKLYNDSNNSIIQRVNNNCTSPNISSEPSWQSITYGENVSFSVVASGDALAYQWQVDTGSGFQNLSDNLFYSNTSTATLQITKPSVSFTESQYRVVVSNSCGTVYSAAAGLQVKAKDITGIFTVSDKTYDTNTSASITSISLIGVLPEDQVSISEGTANFSDPNAETNKAVFLTGAQLSGAHAANYKLLSVSTATATIFKAISTTTVTINGGPFTYSNAPIEPATVTVTGVGLNLSPTATYSDNITAGTATASYSYDGDDNHFPSSDSKTFNIGKADAVIAVVGYSGIYDAQAHGASGSAKDLSGNDLAGLDLVASFTNVPGGIANWTFSDVTGNYNDASGSVEIAIQKADAVISVVGYSGIYDAQVHGASGSAKDLSGNDLAGLDLGASFTNVPGGIANWTFKDVTGNYNDASGSVEIAIEKADATISVVGYSGIYDAQAHGASGSAKDLSGNDLAGLDLGASFTNVPGGTANWTFKDVTGNYKDASGSVEIAIQKADAVISVVGYIGIYDAQAHGASGSAKDLSGNDLAGLDLGEFFTNVPGGIANWTFSDVTGNYNDASGSVEIAIEKADAAISVVGYSGIYDAQAHGASGSAKDLSGNDLAGLDLGASFTNVPGGIANWTFSDVIGNYNDASGSVEIAIQKAPLTITAIDKDKTYDGVPFAGGNGVNYAGFVNNETELVLDGLLSFGGSSQGSVDFGVYEIIPQGLTSVNYDLHSISGTLKINKATLTVSATNLSKYCGQDNPKLIMEYSGFVNQESEAVLDTKPVISTTATWESTGSSYPITVSGGSDNNYDFNYVNGELTINSISIDASSSSTPVQLGSNAVLQAKVMPAVPGVRVSFYLNENWKGETLTNEQGMAALSVAGLPADVYIVKAVAGSGCDQSEAYLPVYDPNGGFVTGGGWIDSPANAMESGVIGKANFGFNAKYKSGKNNTTEVDGNTNFQFKAGDLNFSSSSHTAMSLVISGAKATYTGEGTINGLGNYEFRLIAIDGDLLGNTADKFRIKIWEKGVPSNVVYDNRRGASEAADDASLLGGGSIVIHKPKGNKESESLSKPIAVTKTPIEISMINNLGIAPNPIYDRAEIKVSMLQDAFVKIKLFDLSGRMVRDIYSGKIAAGMEQIINFEKSNLMSGMYILKVYSENGQTMENQIVIK
ncbi:MAG: MBG domain-containing protein [Christiangramia sp.]|uniref:MBG domain-containing protein n=1 Tax=Christiangramia sp. TaxID=1931228 RepID=UPI00324290F5